MLKGIPDLISPELLKVLDEMGHGDFLAIGDGNFPSKGLNDRVIYIPGHKVKEVLKAILKLFPLDYGKEDTAVVMNDDGNLPSVASTYETLAKDRDSPDSKVIHGLEREKFYSLAKRSYAIIQTTDKTLFANIILRKGCI